MKYSNLKDKPKKRKKVRKVTEAFDPVPIYDQIRGELALSQYQAFDAIIEFFKQPTNTFGFMLLSGSAGTGKTYLVSKVAEYMQSVYFCDVLMCAPTNKAVKVMRANCPYTANIKFTTIHSALGLREEIDDYGNIIFRNQKLDDVKIGDYNYVILDEASMVDDKLLKELLDAISATKIKILFVGDRYQIPPVNYTESIIFLDSTKEKYHMKEAVLSVIIRQNRANPIIAFANGVKSELNNPTIVRKLAADPSFQGIPQITFLPQSKETLLPVLQRYFLTDEFDEDADYCKVLAWTNERVNKFNTLIRKMKYGTDVPQLVVGEKIIFDKPWIENKYIVYANNEEVTVRGFEMKTMELFDHVFEYYDTQISKEGSTAIEKHHIVILSETSLPSFIKVKEMLKKNALNHKAGSAEAKGWWATYYTFINKFAAIKYNYAITVHKAQGSTYNHAIVANYDINTNLSVVERNRIKYTAVTRPKENLYIIV